ncbi:tetratricopeptide repeat protein [Paraglaciecola sp. 25GB23A]|uniref:tetratricopeptide repeat protein n=1 Tax=Paraglaciecola sp. 25GB23A TaxID=3156068 RepID=UPI0032B008B3
MKQEPIERALALHQAGKTLKARAAYQKVLKKNPNDVDGLHFFGILNFQQGNTDRAIELIKRSLSVKPDYPDAQNNLGNIYLKLGRLDEAQRCYQETLRLAPNRIETNNNLGVLLRHIKDYPASIIHLKKAIELKSDWADAHYNLANTFAASGTADDAMRHYRAAIKLEPRYSMALKGLGTMLYHLGRIDEAIIFYQDWLELEPDNLIVKHMLAACSGKDIPHRASSGYIKETFDNFASSFDSKLEHLEYKAPQLITEAIDSHITEVNGTLNILDAGCGTGLCGPLLKPLARTLYGVDLSPKMLNLAKERRCYDDLVCEDLVTYINRHTDKFDIIVSADTLIYFGELKDVLNAVARALKPDGLFVFSLEKLTDELTPLEYKLEVHGRYTHTQSYIEKNIKEANLILVSLEQAVLRKELEKQVNGWIVTAKKHA